MACAQDYVEAPYEIDGVNSRDYMVWNRQEQKSPHSYIAWKNTALSDAFCESRT